jgi:SAM-dependent methyltransferase
MEPKIDTAKPHSARMYDYFLGGKDNFAADRVTAHKAMESWPAVRTAVRENRTFLGRAVRYLVAEAGIRQFLDIGTGLPSANNVHEVAQDLAPDCRVVYVDNDPIVLAHARALLTSAPEGRTAYIHADLHDPDKILGDPVTRDTLDFTRPIALMLVAILHFLPDADDPRRIIRALLDALPSGSYLVASHVTPEHDPDGVLGLERTYRAAGVPTQTRVVDDFADLAFTGLDLVDPGLTLVSEWRPDSTGPLPLASEVNWYGGVARKP